MALAARRAYDNLDFVGRYLAEIRHASGPVQPAQTPGITAHLAGKPGTSDS